VRLEGIAVSTGAVVWKSQSEVLVTDAPTPCPKPLGSEAFCVIASLAPSIRPALVALSTQTGKVLASVQNIERLMSTTPGLYQTTSTLSVLAGVRMPGGAMWSKPVTSLFGTGYDPDYGWNVEQYGRLDVGTIGKASAGNTSDLAAFKTVGFSEAAGKPSWMIPGAFQCSGQVGLPGPYLCLMSGTATGTAAGAITTSKNATVTLEGFTPTTGRITWRLRISGLADLLRGNVAIMDAHHLVIDARPGRKLIVDLRSGVTVVPGPRQVFWCEKFNIFRVNAAKGLPGQRVGSSLFVPCDENRRPLATFSRPPHVAGATIGHIFVWAAPDGLKAVREA